MNTAQIALRERDNVTTLLEANVYFAFASGRLTYDCVKCGSKCCRGHGYRAATAAEVVHQISRRPALRLFADSDDGVGAHIRNLPPGCFFLEDGGLCGIHRQDGYSAKPETCRFFPFNSIRRVGEFLIVGPHNELCPLEIAAPGTRSEASEHITLLQSMGAKGISNPVPEVEVLYLGAAKAIQLERALVEMSEEFLTRGSFLTFIDEQIARTASAIAAHTGGPARTAIKDVRIPKAAQALESITRILGLSVAELEPHLRAVTPLLVAVTPAIRARLIFRDAALARGETAVSPEAQALRVPLVILALGAMAGAAAAAGMGSLTYQSLTKLFQEYRPLLRLLANADLAMEWHPDKMIDLHLVGHGSTMWWRDLQTRYVRLVRKLLPSTQASERRALADILCECGDQAAVEWPHFLSLVAPRLTEGLVPYREAGVRRGIRTHELRVACQRWLVAHMEERLVVAVCERMSWRGRMNRMEQNTVARQQEGVSPPGLSGAVV